MPYIKKIFRDKFNQTLDNLPEIDNSGELNYLITSIMHNYLGQYPKYSDYNDVIGALEAAKLELYRTQVSEYEEFKKKVNGDV